MKFIRRGLVLAFCLTLAACSGGSNSRIDYKQARTLPSLDVPPGLGKPLENGADNVPEVVDETAGTKDQRHVLPEGTGIHIARDGSTRWLVIDSSADALWPKLQQFWPSIGLELKIDKPAEGIMETQWAENKADLPQGAFARMVRKVIKVAYSADTRDKYRLRLEPVSDNRTELFLTHYGLKEVAPQNQSGDIIDTIWEVRPSDPELENEILNRLVLYLGGSKQLATAALHSKAAEKTSRSHIDGDRVVLDEGFSRAWRLTGLALDRIGWVVEDRNRSAGIYYVSHIDLLQDNGTENKSGWLSSLFSSDSDKKEQQKKKQWQIQLRGDDTSTRISVYDDKGAPVGENESMPILKKLQENLQ